MNLNFSWIPKGNSLSSSVDYQKKAKEDSHHSVWMKLGLPNAVPPTTTHLCDTLWQPGEKKLRRLKGCQTKQVDSWKHPASLTCKSLRSWTSVPLIISVALPSLDLHLLAEILQQRAIAHPSMTLNISVSRSGSPSTVPADFQSTASLLRTF